MYVPFPRVGEGWQALERVSTFLMCGGGVASFRKSIYLSHVWGRGGKL